jgi:hypothetical protein
MAFLRKQLIAFLVATLFLAFFYFYFNFNLVSRLDFLADVTANLQPVNSGQKLENPPKIFKSIYATGWSAGSYKYKNYLRSVVSTSPVNAVVIDIKDATGVVSYRTQAPMAKANKAYWPEIRNLDALVKDLHSQGVYVIGRIAVFEDGELAHARPDLAIYNKAQTYDPAQPVLWGNNNGLAWVDPASEEVWNYNIEIARDALSHGIDEINFDYVRFPTDGNLKNMGFPKWDKKTPRSIVIKNFFKKVRESLSDATLSVDLFGLSAVNSDDLGIGQILENAFDYFDYVCPMLYPSHFASGFLGFENPAEHPYEVVKYATQMALLKKEYYKNALSFTGSVGKLAKIRPWIQDFDLGAVYDEAMVRQQIDAVVDATQKEYVGFMLWSPSNFYAKEALISPAVATH